MLSSSTEVLVKSKVKEIQTANDLKPLKNNEANSILIFLTNHICLFQQINVSSPIYKVQNSISAQEQLSNGLRQTRM